MLQESLRINTTSQSSVSRLSRVGSSLWTTSLLDLPRTQTPDQGTLGCLWPRERAASPACWGSITEPASAAQQAPTRGGASGSAVGPRIQPAPRDLPTPPIGCSPPLFFFYCSPSLYQKVLSWNRKPSQRKPDGSEDRGSAWAHASQEATAEAGPAATNCPSGLTRLLLAKDGCCL